MIIHNDFNVCIKITRLSFFIDVNQYYLNTIITYYFSLSFRILIVRITGAETFLIVKDFQTGIVSFVSLFTCFWWFGLVVTSLGTSMKLLYIEPG